MVNLPSDIIMNIISFLGGEKHNINVNKMTLNKIIKQKDARLRDMMINDVSSLISSKTDVEVVKIMTVLKRRYIK